MPSELRVQRLIDFPHSAGAEARHDPLLRSGRCDASGACVEVRQRGLVGEGVRDPGGRAGGRRDRNQRHGCGDVINALFD